MSLNWDQVQTEFAGDETTNFGPRNETGTALYQVDTIATITAQNQIPGEVNSLVSASLRELFCVGIDQHLSVFKDSQHEVTIAFENLIEDCAWSPDGSLLLVVEASGKLYIFSAETLQSIFCCSLLVKENTSQRAFHRIAFQSCDESESCDLVLLSATGLLFVVRNFNPSAFSPGGDNMPGMVEEQLQFRKVQTAEVHTDTTLDAVPLGNGSVITVGTGDRMIAMWGWQDNCISLEDSIGDILEADCGIVSAKLASNKKILYILDELNQVSIWLVPELVVLSNVELDAIGSDTSITDFLLLETQGTQTNSLDGTRLVLLLNDVLSSTLQIRDMENGNDMYSLQLGIHTSLSRCATTQETLYVAEGTSVTGNPDKVSTVRLRCLTETNPETRLQRILRKNRFEEALHFARLFQLDTELVYIAQMNQLLEQLSPWNVVCYNDDQVTARLDQLWTSVDNIKDCQLIAENCMRASLPSFKDMWKLLQLCKTKLSSSATNENERQQTLQTKVLDLQNRLMTYKLAFGAQAYSANSWMRFQQANLLHMMCREMMQHQPDAAVLVWRRHCEEWHDQMSVEVIHQILQTLTERLQGESIIGWLRDDLLPFIARFVPQAMASVVQWAVQRAINMEIVEKSDWPQNAISFLEMISCSVTGITEVNFTSTKDTGLDTATKTQIEVYSVLGPLRSTLATMYQLKDLLKYNLRLSVKQFQQETKETLAFRMLDQIVMVELIRPSLEKYITPYMRAHCLNQDSIFAKYIKDLLERLGHVRSYTGQSAWEDKVLAIVSFINNPKEKCCAVSNVIKHAPFPWSPEIQQLVEEGLKIQHPLAQELKEQKKIAGVRQLMHHYGVKRSGMLSRSQAERFALFIVNQDKGTSLDDALRVLKEYNISKPSSVSDIYLSYANNLIRTDRVLDYMKVLKSLDWTPAKLLGQRVVSLAEICLDGNAPQPSIKEMMDHHKQHMTLAAVLTLQHLLPKAASDAVEHDELNVQLTLFSKLLALQREYKLILSVSAYSDEVNRGQIFATFTEKYLREKKPFCQGGDLSLLYRLADLLQLQHEAVQAELAVVEGRAGNLKAVLLLCRELLQAEASRELGQVLHRVVSALLQLQGQGFSSDKGDNNDDGSVSQEQRQLLPVVLEKLACQAVCMCDKKILRSCLELTKAARLWCQVGSQCETLDVSLLQLDSTEPKLTSRDPLQINKLDTVYADEALVMDSAVALPLAAVSLAATSAFVEGDEDGDEEVNSTSAQNVVSHLQPVIHHLRENSHLHLALRFLVHTTSAVKQSLLTFDMGFPVSKEVQSWLSSQQSVMQGTEKRTAQLFQNLMSALLLKVLSAHRVDHKTAMAFLLSVPRKVSVDCLMNSIASCNYNFRKLGVIASIGVALGHLLRESKLISTCQELEVSAGWGVRLGKLKISFKEAFQGGLSAKYDVLAAMAHCDQTDVKMVVDFSLDFRMEAEDSLLVFLEALLKMSPDDRQLAKARAVVTAVVAMDRKDFLLTRLKAVYKQTSPYDYRVIEFLLEEINKLDSSPLYETGLKLVSYLKVYTRHIPPTDHELRLMDRTQENIEECGDAEDLPTGASQRVPLHPLLEGEAWKIITPELDAETVPLWLQIAQLLKLSTDEVYLMAVQNIVHKHVSHTTSAPNLAGGSGAARDKIKPTSVGSWTVSESSLHMLEQVQHLLNCVQSCEMALACANWVVRELPMGGDKVLAIQGCVDFAQRWYKACEDNTPKKEKAFAAYSKFQKVLRKVLTEQVLYKNNLAEPQLLQLVSTPMDLISRLTEHPAVVSDSGQTGPVPDVYSMVEKVCEVNVLDIGQVLVTAMHKWLFSQDSSQDSETTMNLSFSNLKMTEEALEFDQSDIKRVLYFLHHGPREQMLKCLIDIVQTGEGESTSHLGRMNSLYCLLQIGTDADLQPLGLSCQGIRELLRISCYLTQLEELYIQHSVQTLRDCNKMGLVMAIWRNHKHKKSAVRLTAGLCLDYKLYDRQSWAAMLQQMITLHMLSELEHVLQRLRSVPVLWSLPVFTTAWQTVLEAILSKASLPLTEEQQKNCLHCFNLLQSCPVSGQLNLSLMTQHFQRLELDVCAVACVIMDPVASDTNIQDMLTQNTVSLIEQSYVLTAQGLNLPAAVQVREAIFKLILEEGDYHKLPQKAVPDFVHFIIQEDDIDGCLLFATSNDMLSQAETLIELYLQRYPERYEELEAWCDNNGYEMGSSLQAYVHMKEMA